MADDLQELLDRIKWARGEITALQIEFSTYVRSSFRYFFMEHEHKGYNYLMVEVNGPIPVSIKSRSGSIVNELRSCLDGLSSILSLRNNKSANGVYFPIAETEHDLLNEPNLKNKIKKLSQEDRDKIILFRPFLIGQDGRPGNLLLYGLHHADIKRKHHRLVSKSISGSLGAANGSIGHLQTFDLSITDRITKLAAISTDSSATLSHTPILTYAEPDVLRDSGVVECLNNFSNLVEAIVLDFAVK